MGRTVNNSADNFVLQIRQARFKDIVLQRSLPTSQLICHIPQPWQLFPTIALGLAVAFCSRHERCIMRCSFRATMVTSVASQATGSSLHPLGFLRHG